MQPNFRIREQLPKVNVAATTGCSEHWQEERHVAASLYDSHMGIRLKVEMWLLNLFLSFRFEGKNL